MNNPVADHLDFLGELREVIARAGAILETLPVIANLPPDARAGALAEIRPEVEHVRDLCVSAMAAIDDRREHVGSN